MASIREMLIPFLFALILPLTAAQPTYCTGSTNVSTGQVLGYNLNGVAYSVVQNYITPSYAGITVNGNSYTPMYPRTPVTINVGTGSYVEILQINYIPIQPSLNFILCSAKQGPSTYYSFNISNNNYGELYFQYLGTTLAVSSSSNSSIPTTVTMSNVTISSPPPPSGYVKVIAVNASAVTAAPISINMTQQIPCYMSSSNAAVYLLVGGTWTRAHGQFNSSACTVSFAAHGTAAGVFYINPAGTTSSTPSTSTVTVTRQPTSTTTASTSLPSTTIPISTTSITGTTTTAQAGATTGISSSTSTITIPPQRNVTYTGNPILPSDLARYAILAAIAALIVYLIYTILHKDAK